MADAAPRSVGILGGTFNPPHLGHLAVARHAREELALERVLLMPARIPPHKPAGGVGGDPGRQHRLRMCRLLVAGEPGLSACGLEVERDGPSYTVDTLRSIHASHPDARLTFIVGADTARTLGSWRKPEGVLELARLAVATRAGSAQAQVLATIEAIGGAERGRAAAARTRFLRMPEIDVSSSMVRERVARGKPVEELVGPAVAAYIAEHGLYRRREEAS